MGLDVEIALCVIEADALYDLLKAGVVVGIFAVFYPLADQITQYSAEVVVAGIAQERAGVGEHADEVAQQTQVSQRNHLLFHTGLVVVEPPGRAVLDLAGQLAALETADQCTQLCIVNGVQRVQNGLGTLLGLIQCR